MSIEVVSYNPEWPKIFEKEASYIREALGKNCLSLHHIGSTAVPGLSAKPKIDIMAVVKKFAAVDIPALEQLGFENRGEVIASGRYFAKKEPHIHLHLFEEGNPLIERNLIFRDWMRTHEEDRRAYAKLKKELASRHNDGMVYCHAKTEFIDKIVEKASKERKST